MQTEEDIKTVIYYHDYIEVLDQTLLPNTIKYIKLFNTVDAWNAIREMKVRGAPLIAVVALQGIRVELINNKEIHYDINNLRELILKMINYLKTSRPTAVNLSNDLDGLQVKIEGINDPKSLVDSIVDYINQNLTDYENSTYMMANNGADIILKKISNKQNISILTICNTGKLAMPGIGSALGIIREIKKRNKLQTLYIPETRPYNQGSRLTAFEAIVDKLPGVLITDSMIGMLMQKKMVDCVIVGADRVTKLGYTANKIGTYSIAILAKKHEIPFYVACPVSTIDYNMLYGREIEIEERHGYEMRKIGDTYIAPKQIKVLYPTFDITPSLPN